MPPSKRFRNRRLALDFTGGGPIFRIAHVR
jgi:hypothetical protein